MPACASHLLYSYNSTCRKTSTVDLLTGTAGWCPGSLFAACASLSINLLRVCGCLQKVQAISFVLSAGLLVLRQLWLLLRPQYRRGPIKIRKYVLSRLVLAMATSSLQPSRLAWCVAPYGDRAPCCVRQALGFAKSGCRGVNAGPWQHSFE